MILPLLLLLMQDAAGDRIVAKPFQGALGGRCFKIRRGNQFAALAKNGVEIGKACGAPRDSSVLRLQHGLDSSGYLKPEELVALCIEVNVLRILHLGLMRQDGSVEVVGGDAVLFHHAGGDFVALDDCRDKSRTFLAIGRAWGRARPDERGSSLF